ncbi:MAG: hypothetical protein ACKV2O_12685 [Acidimicrobiales bacterium]
MAVVVTATLALFAAVVAMSTALTARPAQADHSQSNQLSWHRLDADTAEFHSEVRYRASTLGSVVVGQTINEVVVNFGDGTASTMAHQVVSINASPDVVVTTAHFTHDFSGPGPFTVTAGLCCRISGPAHVNNAELGVLVSTTVNLGASGSPTSSMADVVDSCGLDTVCTFPVPATDPDGGPLRFRLATPAEAGHDAFTHPPGATIDPLTGEYRWDTTGAALNTAGGETYYSTQVIVERLSDDGAVLTHATVDFLIRLPAPAVPVSTNAAPVFASPTPAANAVILNSLPNLVSFNLAASDPDTTDTVTIAVAGAPDGAVVTSTPGNPASASFNWTPTLEGNYLLTLKATDQVGLAATERLVEIRVLPAPANLPPRVNADVQSDQNVFAIINLPLLLSGEVVDPNPHDVVTIIWDNNSHPCEFSNRNVANPYVTCSQTGTFKMTLSASDGIAPAVSDDIDVIVVPNQPPGVTAGADISGVTGQAVDVNGFVIDANAARETVVSAWTASDPACTFAQPWRPDTTVTCTSPGLYELTLTATDTANPPVSDTVTFTVVQANRAPLVDAGLDSSGLTGEAIGLSGTSTDPDSDPLQTSWAAEPLVPGATLPECTFADNQALTTNVICAGSGTFRLRLTATDATLTATDTLTLVINRPNVAPQVTIGTPAPGFVDEAVSLVGSVTDPDPADVVTVTWSEVVAAGESPSCTFANAAAAITTVTCVTAGSYTVELLADDGFNPPVSATTTVTVGVRNVAPEVNAGGDTSGFVNEPLSLNGTATDATPADALTVTWSQVVAAGSSPVCTFQPVNAVVTSVTCASAGTFSLRLSADDGVNAPVSDTVSVTIATRPTDPGPDPEPALTVDAGADTAGFIRSPVVLAGSASGPGTARWSSSSQRCRFANRSALNTTVTCSRTGTYTLTLTVTDGDGPPVRDRVVVTITRAPRTTQLLEAVLSQLNGSNRD